MSRPPKPMSISEKRTINKMLKEDKTFKQIGRKLGRSPNTIERYLKRTGKADKEGNLKINPVGEKEKVSQRTKEETVLLLTKHNKFSSADAVKMVDKVVNKLDHVVKEPHELYDLIMPKGQNKSMIVNKGVGGQEGVAVMTYEASQQAERRTKKKKKHDNREVNRRGIFIPRPDEV